MSASSRKTPREFLADALFKAFLAYRRLSNLAASHQ
jgi:hypothetical protein